MQSIRATKDLPPLTERSRFFTSFRMTEGYRHPEDRTDGGSPSSNRAIEILHFVQNDHCGVAFPRGPCWPG